ncbi:flavodoxin family protein [Desulfomonile tiedjei]|uniref:Putative flavoprotein n=1 Tax=Desulfomonile tiedjei (strain ATCC 49306 / DSM 6799 / DCB-1) TaxID=706587 RepID=I4CCL8_DESTA|nr:NAD(P)H-dependent oxidoreductase [Desulfomonile tiedjei]AFM27309.1 putative flavoprotein [Desulfomonile tiedjei DSM 6799]
MSAMEPSDKTLLIVYHSQSGNTDRLSRAVERGGSRENAVTVKRLQAASVGKNDLVHCRTLVICSPEYFGYMAGAIKDLFDRTYEDVRPMMAGKAYAIVIAAGNDGRGALQSIERILAGFKLKKVQDPVIHCGPVTPEVISRCEELGQTLAAGMEFGIY